MATKLNKDGILIFKAKTEDQASGVLGWFEYVSNLALNGTDVVLNQAEEERYYDQETIDAIKFAVKATVALDKALAKHEKRKKF